MGWSWFGFAIGACDGQDESAVDTPAPSETAETIESGADSVVDSAPEKPPTSVVFILTDDQRWDTLWAMPSVQENLVRQGVNFTQAIVNTPMCCPTRGSLLSGGFLAKNTGVLSNASPNGGVGAFRDAASLGVVLQQAGYQTALIGKYMNEYPDLAPYIPPGWNSFITPLVDEEWFNYETVIGSSTAVSGTGTTAEVNKYYTEYIGTAAVDFIESTGEKPFFLMLNHRAPHYPCSPAPADDARFGDDVWRGGAYNEEDVSDKPQHIRLRAPITAQESLYQDHLRQECLETLIAADRSVEEIFQALTATGRIEDTAVIFASDNGYLWGEHRQFGKGLPYQEAIRVPLLIRMPASAGVTAPRIDESLVSVSTDVAATIYALANIEAPTEGLSLLPLLRQETVAWRENLYLESYDMAESPNYAGLVDKQWKYIEYTTGEAELYDLLADPLELKNVAGRPDLAELVARYAYQLASIKGLTVTTERLLAPVNQPSTLATSAWGGTPPYTWRVHSGALPEGLVLNSDGRITGTPSVEGTTVAIVSVTDNSVSPAHGGPQAFANALWIDVLPAAELQKPMLVRASGTSARIDFPHALKGPVRLHLATDPSFDHGTRWFDRDERGFLLSGLRPSTAYSFRVDGFPMQSFRTQSAD